VSPKEFARITQSPGRFYVGHVPENIEPHNSVHFIEYDFDGDGFTGNRVSVVVTSIITGLDYGLMEGWKILTFVRMVCHFPVQSFD